MDTTLFRGARFLFGMSLKVFIKSPEQGAQTTIHCAVDEKAGNETGEYYKYYKFILIIKNSFFCSKV